MAYKQKLSQPQLDGVTLLQQVRNNPFNGVAKLETNEDLMLSATRSALHYGKSYLKSQNTVKHNQFRLKANALLNICRQQLYQTQNYDDFDEVEKNAPIILESMFEGNDEEKTFWREQGGNLLNACRRDAEHIRPQKEAEFQQNNLDEMLMETQRVLGTTVVDNAFHWLEQGMEAINQAKELSDVEKNIYRQNYLSGSILNLALQDVDEAEKAWQQYLPNDDDLKTKLAKVRELNLAYEKQVEEEQIHQQKMAQLTDAVQLWQSLELKKINPAQYYVLSQVEGELPLLENDGKYLEHPLVAVYRALRKNDKQPVEVEQMREWQNYLVSAYRQNEIDLDSVMWWQNNLLSRSQGKQKILDDELCAKADKKFGEDKNERTPEALAFMEKKAKFVLERRQ